MTTAAISFSECQGAADRMFAYAILVSQAAKSLARCVYNLHKVDSAISNLLSVATPERLNVLSTEQRQYISSRLQEAHKFLANFARSPEAEQMLGYPVISGMVEKLQEGTEDLGDVIENLILMGDQDFLNLVGACATSLGLDHEANVAELQDLNSDACPEFNRLVAKWKRQFPHIEDDLRKAFRSIEMDILSNKARRMEVGLSNVEVYKYRQNSSDVRRGQSYGWRIVGLYFRGNGTLYPLLIYPKTVFENADTHSVLENIREVMAFLGKCPTGGCEGTLSKSDPLESAIVGEEPHIKIKCGSCGTVYWKTEEWLLTANIA